ncbi:MAG: hypothetical protein GC161_09015 [Planctomycetaceae bacterium]|nr:hypothetical protein [Planctomycetaceae bacterium]
MTSKPNTSVASISARSVPLLASLAAVALLVFWMTTRQPSGSDPREAPPVPALTDRTARNAWPDPASMRRTEGVLESRREATRLEGPRSLSVTGRIRDIDGQVVGGASIHAGFVFEGSSYRSSEDSGALWGGVSCTSSAKGQFRLELGEPRESLVLRIEHDGYLPLELHSTNAAGVGTRDFGDLVLQRGHWFGGRVLDPEDRPVEAAEVLARRLDRIGNEHRAPGTIVALSDSAGAFRTCALEPGHYQLAARSRSGSGPWLSVDTGTMSASGVTLRVLPGLLQAGVVRDSRTGAPLRGWVSFTPLGGGPDHRVPSGTDGRFECGSLAPGVVYVVAVSVEGLQPLEGTNVIALPVAPSGTRVPELELKLHAMRSGAIQIVDGRTGSQVAGAEGGWSRVLSNRIPRTINPLATRFVSSVGASDDHGVLTVPPRPTWSSGLLIHAEGFAPMLLSEANWNDADSSPPRVELWPGIDLEVRVVGVGDGVVAAIDLFLARRNAERTVLPFDTPIGTARTNGSAVFRNLRPDRYVARATSPGSAPVFSEVLELEEGREKATAILQPTPGASLVGRVVGERSGSLWVHLVGPNSVVAKQRVPVGEGFRFADLPLGNYRLWTESDPDPAVTYWDDVRLPGHAVDVELRSVRAHEIALTCEPEASTIVGVVSFVGNPASAIRVAAQSHYGAAPDPKPWGHERIAYTDADGVFEIRDVPGDFVTVTYTQVFGANNQNPLGQRFLRRDRVGLNADFDLESGNVRFRARAVGDGTVESAATFELRQIDPEARRPRSWRLVPIAAGWTPALELPTGTYEVRASKASGERSPVRAFRVTSGSVGEFDLALGGAVSDEW